MHPPVVRCFDRLISAWVAVFIPKSGSRKNCKTTSVSLDKPICTSKETTGPSLDEVLKAQPIHSNNLPFQQWKVICKCTLQELRAILWPTALGYYISGKGTRAARAKLTHSKQRRPHTPSCSILLTGASFHSSLREMLITSQSQADPEVVSVIFFQNNCLSYWTINLDFWICIFKCTWQFPNQIQKPEKPSRGEPVSEGRLRPKKPKFL